MVNVSLRDRPFDAWLGHVPRWPLVVVAGLVVIVTAGLALDTTIARMGDRAAQAGYSLDPTPLQIEMAGQTLAVPTNTIRFAEQRRPGPLERLDLFVHWPELRGVQEQDAEHFASSAAAIVFLTLTPPNGVRKPITRLETVYRYLFDGPSWSGPRTA